MLRFSNVPLDRTSRIYKDNEHIVIRLDASGFNIKYPNHNSFDVMEPKEFAQRIADFVGLIAFEQEDKPTQIYLVKVSIPGGNPFTHAFTDYPSREEVEREFEKSYLSKHSKNAEYLGAIQEGRYETLNHNFSMRIPE